MKHYNLWKPSLRRRSGLSSSLYSYLKPNTATALRRPDIRRWLIFAGHGSRLNYAVIADSSGFEVIK